MRTILLEGGVPEMRTGRAEKPIPPASDPSTWSGRLWTGERRRVFPPNHGDYSAGHRDEARRGGYSALSGPLHKDEVGTWNIIKVSADELRSVLMPASLPSCQLRRLFRLGVGDRRRVLELAEVIARLALE